MTLNKIYTRTGDGGETSLGNGDRRPKFDLRIDAIGAVDEANSAIGLARVSTRTQDVVLDAMLARIQNDLFDLGADLCAPQKLGAPDVKALRIHPAQVERLEREIDNLNSNLTSLRSFVLPGGSAAAAALHVARATVRRAERIMTALEHQPDEIVDAPAMHFINRLSDFLFVAARHANGMGNDDVLWSPGENR